MENLSITQIKHFFFTLSEIKTQKKAPCEPKMNPKVKTKEDVFDYKR